MNSHKPEAYFNEKGGIDPAKALELISEAFETAEHVAVEDRAVLEDTGEDQNGWAQYRDTGWRDLTITVRYRRTHE